MNRPSTSRSNNKAQSALVMGSFGATLQYCICLQQTPCLGYHLNYC